MMGPHISAHARTNQRDCIEIMQIFSHRFFFSLVALLTEMPKRLRCRISESATATGSQLLRTRNACQMAANMQILCQLSVEQMAPPVFFVYGRRTALITTSMIMSMMMMMVFIFITSPATGFLLFRLDWFGFYWVFVGLVRMFSFNGFQLLIFQFVGLWLGLANSFSTLMFLLGISWISEFEELKSWRVWVLLLQLLDFIGFIWRFMRILPSLNRFYFIISIFFYFQFVVGFHTKFLDLTKFFWGA